ncbi:hypothetical protein [Sulfobacillus thermosulfidooxidans]|uniref:hypothetical protein n=1 Tax=Sulfobacillus thermosulfidooxidans TaxID=28034 RepID=UPI0011125EDC|nr:hypothetical protein [Sulfobacillus thermosulfidooxidans]
MRCHDALWVATSPLYRDFSQKALSAGHASVPHDEDSPWGFLMAAGGIAEGFCMIPIMAMIAVTIAANYRKKFTRYDF